jgi:hypothetical protein
MGPQEEEKKAPKAHEKWLREISKKSAELVELLGGTSLGRAQWYQRSAAGKEQESNLVELLRDLSRASHLNAARKRLEDKIASGTEKSELVIRAMADRTGFARKSMIRRGPNGDRRYFMCYLVECFKHKHFNDFRFSNQELADIASAAFNVDVDAHEARRAVTDTWRTKNKQ